MPYADVATASGRFAVSRAAVSPRIPESACLAPNAALLKWQKKLSFHEGLSVKTTASYS